MIKILDNEGEMQVTLTDVTSYQDLHVRLDSEDQDVMDRLYDTPFFAYTVLDSQEEFQALKLQLGSTPIAEVEDKVHLAKYPWPADQLRTLTYEEWMVDCRAWARTGMDEAE